MSAEKRATKPPSKKQKSPAAKTKARPKAKSEAKTQTKAAKPPKSAAKTKPKVRARKTVRAKETKVTAGQEDVALKSALRTRICEMFGIEYPVIQTGMGWVSGATLTSATSPAMSSYSTKPRTMRSPITKAGVPCTPRSSASAWVLSSRAVISGESSRAFSAARS